MSFFVFAYLFKYSLPLYIFKVEQLVNSQSTCMIIRSAYCFLQASFEFEKHKFCVFLHQYLIIFTIRPSEIFG